MRTNYDGSNQNSSGGFGDWDSMTGDIPGSPVNSVSFDTPSSDFNIDDIFEDMSRQASEDSIFENVEDDSLRGMLIRAFKAMSIELEEQRSYSLAYPNVDVNPVVCSPYEYNGYGDLNTFSDQTVPITDVATQEVEKRGISKPLLAAIITGVLIVGVGGTLLTTHLLNKDLVISSDMSMSTIQDELDELYTDSSKSDVKSGVFLRDIESLRIKISAISSDFDSDTDVDIRVCNDMLDELDTIELYMKDKDKLSEYMSLGCSFEREDIDSGISSIQSDIRSYAVAGLRNSVTSLLSSYTEDRNTYFALRDELLAINDASTYNENLYLSRINAIMHSANRSYLQQISNKLLADKTAYELEQKYLEAGDSEKEKYRKELEEANSDRERLESELEDAKKAAKDDTSSKEESNPESKHEERDNSQPAEVESSREDDTSSSSIVSSIVDDLFGRDSDSDSDSATESEGSFFDGIIDDAKDRILGSSIED